jgi:hypothetical protein
VQREGQKTKWIVDLIMKIDGEYDGTIKQQEQEVVSL